MNRPECVTTVLNILADRDVWAEDRQALAAYVVEMEEKVAACQAREAYLREVLEAQPRRMAWVRIEGVDQELPDYATRLRDQALAGHQP